MAGKAKDSKTQQAPTAQKTPPMRKTPPVDKGMEPWAASVRPLVQKVRF